MVPTPVGEWSEGAIGASVAVGCEEKKLLPPMEDFGCGSVRPAYNLGVPRDGSRVKSMEI